MRTYMNRKVLVLVYDSGMEKKLHYVSSVAFYRSSRITPQMKWMTIDDSSSLQALIEVARTNPTLENFRALELMEQLYGELMGWVKGFHKEAYATRTDVMNNFQLSNEVVNDKTLL